MSRHSKWSKVKQFKGAIDAKRSASFTRLAREIAVAAREKGGDVNMNAGLRAAVDRARAASMPKDAIDRAIHRRTGEGKEGEIVTLTYEAYAPGGTALVIECLTDNRNRTASGVKHTLAQHEASFAQAGTVTYLFDRLGVVRIPLGGRLVAPLPADVELSFIEAGASDILIDETHIEVRSAPNDLAKISDAVGHVAGTEESSPRIDVVEFQWIPKTLIETGEEAGMKVAELIDILESDDDVSRVYSNLA